jgi:hypothetical protein
METLSATLEESYALSLVPWNLEQWPGARSVSKGVDWGVIHITLARFAHENGEAIDRVLEALREDAVYHDLDYWKPPVDSVTAKAGNDGEGTWQFCSGTLAAFCRYLTWSGLQQVTSYDGVSTPSPYHMYFSSGWGGDSLQEKLKLRSGPWRLMKVVKTKRTERRYGSHPGSRLSVRASLSVEWVDSGLVLKPAPYKIHWGPGMPDEVAYCLRERDERVRQRGGQVPHQLYPPPQ